MSNVKTLFADGERPSEPSTPEPSANRSKLLVWVGVGLTITAVAVAVWLQVVAVRRAEPIDVSGTLAVLPVVNETGRRESSWSEYGLMEMISETVARTTGTKLVAPRYLTRMIDARVPKGREPALDARRRDFVFALGADYLVEVSWSIRKQDKVLEAIVFGAGGEIGRQQFVDRELNTAVADLSAWLATSASRGVQPVEFVEVYTADPFLNRLYATGVSELFSRNPSGARAYFEMALHHRPNFLEARAQLAECHRRLGDFDMSRSLATSLLEDSRGRAERRLEATALALLARLAAVAGEDANAYDLFLQSFKLWQTLGDESEQGIVVAEGVRVALGSGDVDRAQELLTLALTIQENAGDLFGQMESLLQLGSLHLNAEPPNDEAASEAFQRIAEIADALDDRWTRMRIVSHLGELERRRGNLARATELWSEGLAYHRQTGERSQELVLGFSLAEAYREMGRIGAAEEALREVLELAVELEQESYEARASLYLAELLLRQGFHFQARPHLDRGIELIHWIDRHSLVQRLIAWMAYEQGNFSLALKTQRERAQSDWTEEDKELLAVYERAVEVGRRLPLPHESGF